MKRKESEVGYLNKDWELRSVNRGYCRDVEHDIVHKDKLNKKWVKVILEIREVDE